MPWKETCTMDQKMQMIKYWKNNQVTLTDLSLQYEDKPMRDYQLL